MGGRALELVEDSDLLDPPKTPALFTDQPRSPLLALDGALHDLNENATPSRCSRSTSINCERPHRGPQLHPPNGQLGGVGALGAINCGGRNREDSFASTHAGRA
jgi:hypothetical protein